MTFVATSDASLCTFVEYACMSCALHAFELIRERISGFLTLVSFLLGSMPVSFATQYARRECISKMFRR